MDNSTTKVKDVVDFDTDAIKKEEGDYLPRSVCNSWQIIPTDGVTDASLLRDIHRLNCLGNYYYFLSIALGKTRLSKVSPSERNLHFQMCQVVEKDGLKEVIEIPRDHFKSTIYSEGFPIWRALPFTDRDELMMRTIGYGDRWIQWMKHVHQQDIRIIIVSEVILNAEKLGTKLQSHYENNDVFKNLFPEIIPTSSETWTSSSLHQRRTPAGRIHGEGTFDLTGVGGALQSRHYTMSVQDDMVGRKAVESPSIMQKTIEYHQLLVGTMDSDPTNPGRDNDEIIVGNRWAYNDLNSHVRINEPYFNFTTHSALGGCCPLHPIGSPIFPEAFTVEKLARWKVRLGSYNFSCQFLNTPINPSETKFKDSDIRKFEFITDYSNSYQMADGEIRYRRMIRHFTHEGMTIEDISINSLKRYMIVDPNHAENRGRCRHAITVTGVADDPRRIYLLSVWAKASKVEEFIEEIFKRVIIFKLDEVWLETVAAQKYLKYLLESKMTYHEDARIRSLTIKELKTPKTENAKQMRIDGLGPIFERGDFWANSHGQEEFYEELEQYPTGKLRDVLDTLGYGPSVWSFDTRTEDIELEILQRKNRYVRNIQRTSSTSGY